jgi:hypothetical protein
MRTYRNLIVIIMLAGSIGMLKAQVVNKKLYNPDADAESDIRVAVSQAKTDGKHVFIQIGGNWCVW